MRKERGNEARGGRSLGIEARGGRSLGMRLGEEGAWERG